MAADLAAAPSGDVPGPPSARDDKWGDAASPEAAPSASSPDSAAEPADVVARSTTGAATTALGGLLGRAAGLVTTVLVTHFLSRADYGHANLALIVASIANLATLLSPQQALLTRSTGYKAAARLAHSWACYSGLLVSVLLFVTGPWLVKILGQPEAAPLLQVYCGALFLERLSVIPALSLRYRLRFGDVAKLELTGDLCYVGVTLGAALVGAGALCLPVGMVARQAARLAVLAMQLGKPSWPALPWRLGSGSRPILGEILRYSLPIHLGALGDLATLYLDNVFVGLFYLAAAQGLYAVAYTLVMTPADTIAKYGAIAMVRALGLADVEQRQRVFLRGLRYLSVLLFPIGVGAASVATTLEVAMLPPHWHGVAPIIVGLGGAAMSLGCFAMSFAQLTALQRPGLGGLLPAVRLVLFALFLFAVERFDTPRQHLPAVAWAVSAAFLLATLLALGLSAYADRLRPWDLAVALAPPLAGAAVMGLGLWATQIELASLGIAPSLPRLCFEIAWGALLYALYLRLLHRALWAEGSAWLRQRLSRSSS